MDSAIWSVMSDWVAVILSWVPVVVIGFNFDTGTSPTQPTRQTVTSGQDFLGPGVRQAVMGDLFRRLGIQGQFTQQPGQPTFGEGFKGQRGPQTGTTPGTLGFTPGAGPGAGQGAPGAGTPGAGGPAPFSWENQLQSAFQAPRAVNPFVGGLQQTFAPNQNLAAFNPLAQGQAAQLFGGSGVTPTDVRLFGQGQQALREGLTQRGLNLSPAGGGIEADFTNRYFQDLADRQFGRQQSSLQNLLGGAGQEQAGQALNLQRLLGGAGAFEAARGPDAFTQALQGVGAQQAQEAQQLQSLLAILSGSIPREFGGAEGGGGGGSGPSFGIGPFKSG